MGDAKAIGQDAGVRIVTGEADIDISEANYATGFQPLLTITPAAGKPCKNLVVHFDLQKTTTGFTAVHSTSETIQFAVARKVDGTNWVRDIDSLTTARAEDLAGLQGQSVSVGSIGPDEEARIEVTLSAEVDDVELPYAAYYEADDPATFTAVAAA